MFEHNWVKPFNAKIRARPMSHSPTTQALRKRTSSQQKNSGLLWVQGLWMLTWGLACLPAYAGEQENEALADAVRAALQQTHLRAVPYEHTQAQPDPHGADALRTQHNDRRLSRYISNPYHRQQLTRLVHYEAQRAGLEPALVMAVIEVESHFNSNAVSSANARGLMQVMPFWTRAIGDGQVNTLHQPQINIRYGCVILRHYLDIEQGNILRALGRYNGSLGQMHYPQKILTAWQHWR